MSKKCKCSYAYDQYKAKKGPKCGCPVCEYKWSVELRLRQLEQQVSDLNNPHRIYDQW